MKGMIKYGFILGAICFSASAVLAVVNVITEPKIKLQQEKEERLALQELLPQAAVFKPNVSLAIPAYYVACDKEGRVIGFIIRCEGRGYSSDISTLAALNPNLEITDIKILSHNETPGLGSRIDTPVFKRQFKGKKIESLDQIQAITGATISSAAVVNSIKNKISELKGQLVREMPNGK